MKRRRFVIASVIYSFIIVVFAMTYIVCKNMAPDEEDYNNAKDMYIKISENLSDMVEDKWRILEIIKENIDENNNRLNMSGLREQLKDTGFENGLGNFNIIFIDIYENYISLDGKRGCLNNDINIKKRLADRFIASGKIIANEDMVMFGMSVPPSKYNGFEYCTIASVYSKEYIENVMNIYDNSNTSWFIAGINGNILYKHNGEDYNINNIINYYEDTAQLDYEQLTVLKDKLADCGSGTISYSEGRERYFLTYIHNMGDDWSLIGLGPSKAYAGAEDYIKVVIVAVIFAVFIAVIICVNVMMINEEPNNVFILDEKSENKRFITDALEKGYENIFIILSEDCSIVEYVSRNIQEVLGIDYELVSKNDVKLLKVEDGRSLLDIEEIKLLKPGEEQKVEEEYINLIDGQRHWYLKTIYHANNELENKYMIVISDKTNEHEKDRHIQQALDIARNANMAKDKFLSSLSHDTRTPVNAISGMAALIAKEAGDKQKVIEYAEKISESCQHLQNLVNEILDISKIESGKSTLNTARFSMAKLLQDISQVVRVQARNKNQMFIIETDNLCHNIFVGDKMRISQVIINLLSNAIKYTSIKGIIKLCIREETLKSMTKCASKLVFTIMDNGSGMSREYQSVLFEPFSRENSINVVGVQGTGLGMSITKSLVELMGGTIDVSSQIGRGSKFTVTIYLEAEEVHTVSKRASQTCCEACNSFGVAGKKALVAEDYSINAKLLTEILKMEGISSDIATDGREAVKMFEASSKGFYDVILMDIHMPLLDGYDATRLIRSMERSDAKSIPIVAMTASAFEKEIIMAKEAGMDEYITKPINIKAFRNKLCKLLEDREALKEQ